MSPQPGRVNKIIFTAGIVFLNSGPLIPRREAAEEGQRFVAALAETDQGPEFKKTIPVIS